MQEKATTGPENREFQAEVKHLLDIVVNSLYTEKEIFLRELISNAADALEKLRYESLTGQEVADAGLPLEINIEADEETGTLTVADTGVGMTKEELIENLGTIAHSGSRQFIRQLAEAGRSDLHLIGQFGVGFYSAFMVAREVYVFTRSYKPGERGWEWSSDGSGGYQITPAEGLERGTKVSLILKDDALEFARPARVKEIIRKYSSFVSFPIKVNGEQVNTVQAIWTRNKSEVSDEEYEEFYKFIAGAYDKPMYWLHFSSDAPLSINALLFVPEYNFERFGFGRVKPGVSLYSRKVLIEQEAQDLLPEWLRFVKGIVDSEDIPLNISRETAQDKKLLKRLKKAVTGRFLNFLKEQAEKDPEKYTTFWNTFGDYLREGAATDEEYRQELADLLRFESSKCEEGKLTSLAGYKSRMKENQKEIYFLNGPSREAIEGGPYMEAFLARDLEVIYTRVPVEDYILSQLGEYGGAKFVPVDRAGLELPPLEGAGGEEPLSEEEMASLTAWLKETLDNKVSEVRSSTRLTQNPAVILNKDTAMTSSMQRVMQSIYRGLNPGVGKVLEVNPRHRLIKRLHSLKSSDPNLARSLAEQVLDNALLSAGLLVETRAMVERIYKIMECAAGIPQADR